MPQPPDPQPIVPEPTDIGEFRRDPPPAAATELPHPPKIGRYRILEVLGQGGMGTVYLAEQTEPIQRQVAIKLIRSSRLDTQFTHRFEAERQALARMSHPCIAQVYEAGDTENGQPFFAMEHVPGLPITGYCDRERLTIDQRLDLFVAVCRGIHHAHQKGVLHRDIKPENIILDSQGNAKIMDFGLARPVNRLTPGQTQAGFIVGTPHYLAPEQLEGKEPDTRADVYACGVVLFEVFTGRLPFGGSNAMEIILKHLKEAPASPREFWPEIPAELERILLKCLEKAPEARFADAGELGRELERLSA